MKSLKDQPVYETESDKQDKALGTIAGFISQEEVNTAKINDLTKKVTPGSFGHIASNVVEETMALFTGESTLSRIAAGQTVGQMFRYKGALLVLTPFKTVVGVQAYVDALQNRVLELTTVSAELEINQLKKEIKTVTNGGFFDLIGLAFKRLINNLFKGKNNG